MEGGKDIYGKTNSRESLVLLRSSQRKREPKSRSSREKEEGPREEEDVVPRGSR